MRVAVTGASGFIGSTLVRELRARGNEVIALGRDPARLAHLGTESRRFDPNWERPQPEAFEGVDAVIHLAGESVSGRWTLEKKHAVRHSRVVGTRTVVASLAHATNRPRILLSSSATGYYGDRADSALDERSRCGDDFLAHVCRDWESEAREAERFGIRTVCLRTGVVLGRDGGALAAMLGPFRLGVGGPMGNGRQYLPWIHLDDLVALYCFALKRNLVRGAVNAVTPDYATNMRFAQALGAALHRPAILPAPAFALRAILGEFASTLLGGQLVIPAAALDAGFLWRHDRLEDALANALGVPDPWRTLHVFQAEEYLDVPIERVYEFFSSARNLEAITPPSLRFALQDHPAELRRGSEISYALRLHGVPFRWKTLISHWNAPYAFDDVQLRGPYALWHHEHRFDAKGSGTTVRDRVTYALPAAPISNLALRLVERDVRSIFAFRTSALKAWAARAPRVAREPAPV